MLRTTIDRDIPLPTLRSEYRAYLWLALGPGESFYVAAELGGRTADRLQTQLSYHMRGNPDRRFTSRRDAKGGIRIWRTR